MSSQDIPPTLQAAFKTYSDEELKRLNARQMETKTYQKPISEELAELIGFVTHMYRHYYRAKLTEMHPDDFTIAKLLGYSSVENVKYYRKMSSQILADETVERGHRGKEGAPAQWGREQ